jgi:hypothetical protein
MKSNSLNQEQVAGFGVILLRSRMLQPLNPVYRNPRVLRHLQSSKQIICQAASKAIAIAVISQAVLKQSASWLLIPMIHLGWIGIKTVFPVKNSANWGTPGMGGILG